MNRNLGSEASSRSCLHIDNWFTVLREALDDYLGVGAWYETNSRVNTAAPNFAFPLATHFSNSKNIFIMYLQYFGL